MHSGFYLLIGCDYILILYMYEVILVVTLTIFDLKPGRDIDESKRVAAAAFYLKLRSFHGFWAKVSLQPSLSYQ